MYGMTLAEFEKWYRDPNLAEYLVDQLTKFDDHPLSQRFPEN